MGLVGYGLGEKFLSKILVIWVNGEFWDPMKGPGATNYLLTLLIFWWLFIGSFLVSDNTAHFGT